MERAEAAGLGVAVLAHGALLAALTLGLFSAAAPPPPAPSIEVSFVDQVALDAAAPVPASAPPPSAPEEAAVPDDAPTPSEAAPQAPVLAPAPVARETPAPTPPRASDSRDRRRPEEPRQTPGQRQRAARLADLNLDSLGRDPAARPTPQAAPAAAMSAQARASVRQVIARALMRCQRQPLPTPEAAAIRVDYRITLNRDGSLSSAEFVRVINPDPALAPYERRMRDLALNVINSCTPIRGLPPEFYDVPGGWRRFPYQFDPRTVR